jgi:hypothetical protein
MGHVWSFKFVKFLLNLKIVFPVKKKKRLCFQEFSSVSGLCYLEKKGKIEDNEKII